jgi:uroporphyrinogen-III synthase
MRVLVTRPREDAERTARRLVGQGHEAIVAPLITVVATEDRRPDGPVDAVILTSGHAVPALASLDDRNVPVVAVGERTAAAARQAGFDDVRSGDGAAAALTPLIVDNLPSGSILLHIAGRYRKAEPELSLRTFGYRVLVWEAYEARAATELPSELSEALGAGRIDVVLHYSRRSAALLVELAVAAGLALPLGSATHLCLSGDVAAPLAALGWPVMVAAEPNEGALLAALETIAESSPPRASSANDGAC